MKLSQIKIVPLLDSINLSKITDEEYFGENYKRFISNSSLSLINPLQGGNPIMYKEGLTAYSKYSDSLYFGSAVHQMVLEPEEYIICDSVDRPTAKLGFMADELYKYVKVGLRDEHIISASDKIDYYKGKMDEIKRDTLRDKCLDYWESRMVYEKMDEFTSSSNPSTSIYLDPKSREKLYKCLESVKRNKEIQNLLRPEGLMRNPDRYNEYVLTMDVQVIFPDSKDLVLSLKAKLDNFTVDYEMNEVVLNDLKTTGKYTTKFVESFYKYHYYRQMGMYGWMLRMAAKQLWDMNSPSMKANMLVVSTVPNYYSTVFAVFDTHIKRGIEEFSELLKRVAYHEYFGYDIAQPEL